MINYKDFKELDDYDKQDIIDYIETLCVYIPIVDEEDYLKIKKYIRKILEIIEEKNDENQ